MSVETLGGGKQKPGKENSTRKVRRSYESRTKESRSYESGEGSRHGPTAAAAPERKAGVRRGRHRHVGRPGVGSGIRRRHRCDARRRSSGADIDVSDAVAAGDAHIRDARAGDALDVRGTRETRETRETCETCETCETHDAHDAHDAHETRDTRGTCETRDTRETRGDQTRRTGLRLRRLPRLRSPGRGPDRPARRVAGRHLAARRAHVSAGRPLEQHRGRARLPRRLGGLAARAERPDARSQRADAGAQRAERLRRRCAAAAGPGRRRSVRPALPRPRPALGRTGGAGHRHRARLGDERHYVHPSLRTGPGGLEEVLEQNRHHHAFGAGPEIPVRLRSEPWAGRHSLDAVLSRGRHGRHHRHGFVRPAAGAVIRRGGERAVWPSGTCGLRQSPWQTHFLS